MKTGTIAIVGLTLCIASCKTWAAEMLFTAATTVSTNIFLSEDTTITVNAAATALVTFSGVISGPGKLIKNGAARIKLTGNNTYTGGTDINQGRVYVSGNSALGTGLVRLLNDDTQLGADSRQEATVDNDIEVYGDRFRAVIATLGDITFAGNFKTMSGTDDFLL